MRPLELVAHITILVLVCIAVSSAIYLKWTRQCRKEPAEITVEEAHVRTTSRSLDCIKPVSPKLPLFNTRSSLSLSSSPTTPRTPKTPNIPSIRFAITPTSRRSRNSGSIDSLPSVETVLEQYEREADAAAERLHKPDHNQILKNDDLGEPGRSVVEEKPLAGKKSFWDRPQVAERAAKEA